MTKKTRNIVIISTIAVLVIGLVWYRMSRSQDTYDTEPAVMGPVVEQVSVTGSIAPISKIDLQPEAAGKIVEIAVKEGDLVKAGDPLIKIDSRDIEARVASQRAAVDAARAQLRELQSGATPEELQVSAAAVDTARAQLDSAMSAKTSAETTFSNAQANLANTKLKADTLLQSRLNSLLLDYDEAVTVATDSVNRSTSQLFTGSDFLSFTASDAQAESDANSTRTAAKTALPQMAAAAASAKSAGTLTAASDNYAAVIGGLSTVKSHADACAQVLNYAAGLSSTTLSSYQLSVSTAQTSLNVTISKLTADKSNLDLQQRLNDTDIKGAEISAANAEAALVSAGHAIETSQRALDQAQANYELKKVGARQETIDSQRARVAAEEAALSGLLTELSKRSILAPLDAVVTEIPVELGETVQPGRTVVSLNTKDHFEIVANISEVDIARIAVGQPVEITLDAFSSTEKWSGKVVSIQPAEKVVQGVIFYETKIVFNEDDPRLKSGMTANLDIETERKEDVLHIPLRALKESLGRQYVQVLVNGKVVEKDIKTGLESNEAVEVVSGLAEGEEVIVGTSTAK